MSYADILIVDDEADIRGLVKGILDDEGYITRVASNSSEAYREMEERLPSLVVLDIWLQGSEHDGMEILENIKEKYSKVPVLMISGHGSIETAVTSIKYGAYDFIEKPFKSDRLLLMIERALETASLRYENAELKKKSKIYDELIGSSPVSQNIKQVLKRVATTNSRVLLTGNAGTGKDVAARFLHQNSGRVQNPYMILNCATLQPERLEVELFGSVDGYSNQAGQIGILEKANGGTVFLDEVADMPLETQGKIVRVLQNQEFQKLGDKNNLQVDVRIIASSNKNLEEEIKQGRLREDLFYRLNVVPIRMPDLSERTHDIPELVEYFLNLHAKQNGKTAPEMSAEALYILQSYNWPGNIRQLRNVLEWVLIMHANETQICSDHLPPEITGVTSCDYNSGAIQTCGSYIGLSLREAREQFETEYLQSQIARFDGNISKTAQFVGMERSALHRKLKSLNITLNDKNENSNVTELKQRA